uniref:USP domain-containing protein n=1 Tax=Helicotheca tamesis TaxID=374047 RepID=A0A7S2H6K6_9STRA|mmetsp:Transcript_15671/g.21466  ORF Transcript_15671/g.21466 Transcript_15671/m.21466 type:complete len:567 (+) Transcript_15671:51-1751(+)
MMTCPICSVQIPADRMKEHFDTVHDVGGSSAPVTSGLKNDEGQHSCFLNAALQALWHTDSFRQAIAKVKSKGPLHSMIQSIFSNIEHAVVKLSGPIPADLLRAHLADLFAPSERFQLGEMDDSGEALEAILETLHKEHVGIDTGQHEEEGICNPLCVAHSVFGLTTFDQTRCLTCGANSDPEIATNLVYRAYATDILVAAREQKSLLGKHSGRGGIGGWLRNHLGHEISPSSSPEAMLSGVLCSAVESMPKRECPSHDHPKNRRRRKISRDRGCRGSAKVQRFRIGQKPKVLAVQIVWPADSATKGEVQTVLNSLDECLSLEKLFMGSDETIATKKSSRAVKRGATYRRLGVINFYGQHYTSVFSVRPRGGEYILCDDETVRAIGQWDDAKKRLVKGRWMPTMVLYEDNKADKPVTASSPQEQPVVTNTTSQQSSPKEAQLPSIVPTSVTVRTRKPNRVGAEWGRRYYVVLRVEPGHTGIGLMLRRFEDGTRGLEVIGWEREINGSRMSAQQSKRINIGDRVLSFNDRSVGDMSVMQFRQLEDEYVRPCLAGYGVTLELRLQERYH